MSNTKSEWTIAPGEYSINLTHQITGRTFMFWKIDEPPFIDIDVAVDADDAKIDNFGDILDEAINLVIDYAAKDK